MSEEIEIVKISVRNLVEFILRSGDITSSGSGLKDPEVMPPEYYQNLNRLPLLMVTG